MLMRFILIVFLSCVVINVDAQVRLPPGKTAIIVLTYDDGIASQLNIAIPQLNEVKLKGTFFLTGNIPEDDVQRWRDAAKKGHELANHSLYHPCSREHYENRERLYTENYDVASMIDEIAMTNRFLFMLDGKKGPRTYAYPCSGTVVGSKDYASDLKKSNLISYARVGGDRNSIITEISGLDSMRIPSNAIAEGTRAEDMINYVKDVQRRNGLGIFMFHGVGGDYISVSADDHRKLLEYLSHNKDILVCTFEDAVRIISK